MSSQGVLHVFCVGCGILLGLLGCSSEPGRLVDPVARTNFWKPYLLFIQSTPYSRLYVEVDTVEGMAPDDESLRSLQDFLTAHCTKPAGIQIVRDSVIPRDQARGIAPGSLARKYLAGPHQDASESPAAFIYVLFFDAALSRDPGPGVASTTTPSLKAKLEFPHAELLPYPASVYADPQVNGPLKAPKVSRLWGQLLQHEAGHLLGLGRNPTHSAGGHCLEKSCIMYAYYSPFELLMREIWADDPNSNPVLPARFCANCEADAQAYVREPSPSNLRFVGPVLVRLEPGYQVLALPDRLKLVVGRFDEQDAWDFMRAVKEEPLKPTGTDSPIVTGKIKPEARQDQVQLRETLKRAKQDPLDIVRMLAAKL